MNGSDYLEIWWKLTIIAIHQGAGLPFNDDDPSPFTECEMLEMLANMAKNRAENLKPIRE